MECMKIMPSKFKRPHFQKTDSHSQPVLPLLFFVSPSFCWCFSLFYQSFRDDAVVKDFRDYLTERQISKLEGVFLRYDRRNTGDFSRNRGSSNGPRS